ncbi:unnamed protein product, partial [Allacma fusca]
LDLLVPMQFLAGTSGSNAIPSGNFWYLRNSRGSSGSNAISSWIFWFQCNFWLDLLVPMQFPDGSSGSNAISSWNFWYQYNS